MKKLMIVTIVLIGIASNVWSFSDIREVRFYSKEVKQEIKSLDHDKEYIVMKISSFCDDNVKESIMNNWVKATFEKDHSILSEIKSALKMRVLENLNSKTTDKTEIVESENSTSKTRTITTTSSFSGMCFINNLTAKRVKKIKNYLIYEITYDYKITEF